MHNDASFSTRAALLITALPYVVVMVAMAFAMPDHILDVSWPDHARNHVLQSLLLLEGYCIVSLLVIANALRKGDTWAWWTTLLSGVFLFGGYLVAVPLTGGGAPGMFDDLSFAVLWLVQVLGLAGVWRTQH